MRYGVEVLQRDIANPRVQVVIGTYNIICLKLQAPFSQETHRKTYTCMHRLRNTQLKGYRRGRKRSQES